MSTEPLNTPPLPDAPEPLPPGQMNWGKFFCILLAPAVLSPVLMQCKVMPADVLGTFTAVVGSIAGGVHCAGMLARHLSERKAASAAMTVGFSFLFVSLSMGLCFMGCAVVFGK